MRKSISFLCGVVHERMGCSVRNGDVFIFIGSSRKLMKLLHAYVSLVVLALLCVAYILFKKKYYHLHEEYLRAKANERNDGN